MNSDAEPIETHFTAAVNEHPILAITPRGNAMAFRPPFWSSACWARSGHIFPPANTLCSEPSPASTRNLFAIISRRPLGRPTTM